jgi:hypothetical protein
MEAIRSSETPVNSRSTQRHTPEDDILQDFILPNFYFLLRYIEKCGKPTDWGDSNVSYYEGYETKLNFIRKLQ